MENFVLYDELGRGDQRIVYKGRKKGTIEYLAIHCVEKSKREELQNSVRISHDLNHKNIVQFHEWYETTNHLWLVVELCTGLTLDTILVQDDYLPEKTIRGFGRDIVEALFYLHSRDVIYCDLVPSKVVLDGSGVLKLSNFSLSKYEGEVDQLDEEQADIDLEGSLLEGENVSRRVVQGSPFYIAPEVLKGGLHTKSSDLWALGCLLYECFTGSSPYTATKFDELVKNITLTNIPFPIQGKGENALKSSETFQSLINSLLVKDPFQRIGLYELCKHEFWNGTLLHILNCKESITFHDFVDGQDSLQHSVKEGDASNHSFSFSKDETFQDKNNWAKKEGQDFIFQSFHSHENSESLETPTKAIDSFLNLGAGSALSNLRHSGQKHNSSGNSQTRESDKYSNSRESKQRSDLNASLKLSQLQISKSDLSILEGADFGLNLNLVDLLYHPSDLEVSPIIDNPKIQKHSVLKWDTHHIPFPTLKIEKIDSLKKEEIHSHIATVSEFFEHLVNGSKSSGGVAVRAKIHTLSYLCNLSRCDKIANSLIERDFVQILIDELKGPGTQDVKIKVGRLLGTLACSATYVSSTFKMTDVFTTIMESLRENICVVPLKVALLPALGEFMFYAATQEEGEDKMISNWDPPGAMFTIVSRCLQPGEDILVQHFAAKIIENIVTTAGRYCKKFLTKEIGFSLWNLFSHSVTDAEKVTASSALCRLSMHSKVIILQVMERIGIDAIWKALFAGTSRIQQSLLTIIITLLSNPTYFKRISSDANAIHKTIRILESSSFTLRGKVYLFVSEISLKSSDVLLECLKAKIVTFIERDIKKSSANAKCDAHTLAYARQCLELAVGNILKQVPIIMSEILKVLDAVIGRHHPSAAHIKQIRGNLPHLSILLHIVTSQVFRPRIVNDAFIEALGSLLNFVYTVDTGQTNISSSIGGNPPEEITRTVFSIVEAIAQHPFLLLQYRETFITVVLPHLSLFCQSSSGDNRMWSTKMFSDIASLYFENDDCAQSASKKTDQNSKALQELINDTFVENMDTILQDQDPIPSYGLKLLQSYVDHTEGSVTFLIEKGVMRKVLHLFETHQDDAGSSAILAIMNFTSSIVSSSSNDLTLLCEQGLIDYLMSAFIVASAILEEDEVGDSAALFFLPLLDTLRQLLQRLEAQVKKVVRSKDGSNKPRTERSQDVYNVEQLLQRCKILSDLNGVLMTLLCFDDEDVQEWASHCLYISAELFGGEYEASFSEDNLECLIDAIQLSNDKRKKLLLRIVKRFVTSNVALLRVLQDNGDDLRKYLLDIISTSATNAESRAVQASANEVLRLMKHSKIGP